MNEPSNLEDRIREKLATAEAKRRERQAALAGEMECREKRIERFDTAARRWTENAIVPAMRQLAACFGNARLGEADAKRPYHCVCSFDRTPQFPATTTLELAVFPDASLQNGVVAYSVDHFPRTSTPRSSSHARTASNFLR